MGTHDSSSGFRCSGGPGLLGVLGDVGGQWSEPVGCVGVGIKEGS